jgi:hypothetical protein
MKKWETPILSLLRRSTTAEKVLSACKWVSWPSSPHPTTTYKVHCVSPIAGDACQVCLSCLTS